ncbi:uncharacterized protein cntrob isoform X2 [Mustelus asterias]
MQRDSRWVSTRPYQAMDSPIRSEDLMSDIEPLPASAPASAPASPRSAWPPAVPCFDRSASTAVARSLPSSPCASLSSSSEVTTRLYASLQLGSELGAPRCPPGGSSSKQVTPSERREALAHSDGHSPPPPGSHSRTQTPEPAPKLTARSRARPGHRRDIPPADPPANATSRHLKSVQFAKEVPARSELEEPAVEVTQRLSRKVEAGSGAKIGSRHISEMESVRSHLQNMLKLSQELTSRDADVSPTSPTLTSKAAEDQRDDDSFESDCTSTLLSAKPFQGISVSPPLPFLGLDEAALFPRYSRIRMGTGEGLASESSLYECQILKDTLDKERTRRKHCERQIQGLQNKILELQQQLAVAVSADRKKDIMIEQLDKTLVKVVDGWKKHDAEKSEAMRQLQEEREAVEKRRGKQQQALFSLEHHLTQANQTLAKEQREKGLLEEERGVQEEENRRLQKALEAEQQRCQRLQGECDAAQSGRQHERKQAEALRTKLGEEREAGGQREKQLEQRNAEREEELQEQLEREKASTQRETQRAQDAQQVLASVQTELQRLEIELDTARREKETLQMDLSLVKARFESQRVRSETEFKMTLEQQVTERLTAVHEESTRQTAAVREQHRKQLLELAAQHEHEMGKQLAEFKSERQEREEKHRHLIEGYEIRLAKAQEEMGRLLVMKRKLEVQRGEMVSKLQSMMQSQWNEALKVLLSEDPPPGHQRATVVLHHEQVPVYRELNCIMATSGSANDPHPSSSSGLPHADPGRLHHSSGDGVSLASGSQARGKLVELRHSGWLSQRSDLRLPALPPDGGAPEDRIECGQLPYANPDARQAVEVPLPGARHFHGPQAIPLQPVLQASSHRPAPAAVTKGYDANVPSGHETLASDAAEILKHERYLQQCEQLTGHSVSSEQGQGHSVMFPLLPNQPSLEDLSQLLNYSFLSHASFQPLDLQTEETMLTAHPDELAEHPFTDDADDSGQSHCLQPSEGGTTRNSSFESSGGRSSRSSELQYYIQMLLDRSPGDPVEGSEETEKLSVAQSDAASQQ